MRTDGLVRGRHCEGCSHFRKAPEEVGTTGCYHPDHMEVVKGDGFLYRESRPGEPAKLNRRGSCREFVERPQTPGFWGRLLGTRR